MDLYRTSESGLVAVRPLEPGETAGLADALLRGPGGELGAEDVLFVAGGDGAGTALALDAEGSVVVVGAADGEVGNDTVTGALQHASAVAEWSYEALDERYDGGGSLREAHARYFDREPLAPGAFNRDQRVRLLGTAFADEALDLATFLSDRELAVDTVAVEAFEDPASDGFLVRFAPDGDADAEAAEGGTGADEPEQWVAGASTTAAAAESTTDGTSGGEDPAEEAATADAPTGNESALAGDDEPADEPESLELPVLLEAVADGVKERLVGIFDADPDDIVSVERGNELLVRPDHPAYAGGVLRYRLRVRGDGTASFEVNIYGGSEAEKEQMRAVIRENEEAVAEELGYEVAEGYDGIDASREFASLDQVAAAEIVDEFDRLVRFFNPRVMRA